MSCLVIRALRPVALGQGPRQEVGMVGPGVDPGFGCAFLELRILTRQDCPPASLKSSPHVPQGWHVIEGSPRWMFVCTRPKQTTGNAKTGACLHTPRLRRRV